jgi:hypothetical protein
MTFGHKEYMRRQEFTEIKPMNGRLPTPEVHAVNFLEDHRVRTEKCIHQTVYKTHPQRDLQRRQSSRIKTKKSLGLIPGTRLTR